MTKLDDHPSVVRFRQSEPRPHPGRIDVERLRRICLDAGADDVGFVAIDLTGPCLARRLAVMSRAYTHIILGAGP
jgi:hypothetical protein